MTSNSLFCWSFFFILLLHHISEACIQLCTPHFTAQVTFCIKTNMIRLYDMMQHWIINQHTIHSLQSVWQTLRCSYVYLLVIKTESNILSSLHHKRSTFTLITLKYILLIMLLYFSFSNILNSALLLIMYSRLRYLYFYWSKGSEYFFYVDGARRIHMKTTCWTSPVSFGLKTIKFINHQLYDPQLNCDWPRHIKLPPVLLFYFQIYLHTLTSWLFNMCIIGAY